VAFVSGFATLGLEVLWTRMFAQVLHNSVYSFAVILVTFLVCLGCGSALAHGLSRRPWSPPVVLVALLFAAGGIFGSLLAGFVMLEALGLWGSIKALALLYFIVALWLGGGKRGIPSPAQRGRAREGAAASDDAPAARGPLPVPPRLRGGGDVPTSLPQMPSVSFPAVLGIAPALALLLFATVLDPSRLPIVAANPRAGEVVYEKWEGRHGVVAVVGRDNDLRIKVDNYYSLGGTGSRTYEETQADIPLVIHPRPRSAFFLGMGTGITAGASLLHPLEEVTTVELIPEVAEAARRYFGKYTNGLFSDPRSTVVIADGRNYLLGRSQRYDVIVSDLFIPWQAGAGSLYTREHFEIARARLNPGGVFAQWLPLYQLSQADFAVIARTMLEVFPQVTMWRGDFLAERPIVALVGQEAGAGLDAEAVVANFRKRRGDDQVPRRLIMGLTGLFYCGNLTEMRAAFAETPVNTDDFPVIEYSTPIAQREHWGSGAPWFTSFDLMHWYDRLLIEVPPDRDPYLRALTPEEAGFVRAGLALFKASAHKKAGDEKAAEHWGDVFTELVPADVNQTFKRRIEEE
jgi:spermidine synthase